MHCVGLICRYLRLEHSVVFGFCMREEEVVCIFM